MKKYPLLYFTNIILNKQWNRATSKSLQEKKIHFQLEQNVYKKNNFIVKSPHLCSLL